MNPLDASGAGRDFRAGDFDLDLKSRLQGVDEVDSSSEESDADEDDEDVELVAWREKRKRK